MQFTTPADRDNYGQWIENNDYAREHRGQYAERNSSLTPWEHMLDLHFAQDFYYLKERGSKITLTFDILNLGNLINHHWGKVYNTTFGYAILKVDNVKKDEAGNRYGVFSYAGQEPQINQMASRWHMQLGLRVTF
jgi:hypothetical protein